jgi:hypothetical protein
LEILLVEDSPGDVRLTQEAFREANTRINLQVAADGAGSAGRQELPSSWATRPPTNKWPMKRRNQTRTFVANHARK